MATLGASWSHRFGGAMKRATTPAATAAPTTRAGRARSTGLRDRSPGPGQARGRSRAPGPIRDLGPTRATGPTASRSPVAASGAAADAPGAPGLGGTRPAAGQDRGLPAGPGRRAPLSGGGLRRRATLVVVLLDVDRPHVVGGPVGDVLDGQHRGHHRVV